MRPMTNINELKNELAQLLASRDMVKARSTCNLILERDKSQHFCSFILGMSEYKRNNFDIASAYFKSCLNYQPHNPQYQINYAKCLMLLGRREAAKQVVSSIEWKPIKDIRVLCAIGQVLSTLEMHIQAEDVFRIAVNLNRNSVIILYNLATTLRYLGKFEEAEEFFERVIKLDPLNASAHYSLSTFVKITKEVNHIDRLVSVLRKISNTSYSFVQLNHALYLEYEAITEYDKAFKALEAGNKLYFNQLSYNFSIQKNIFDGIRKSFSKDGGGNLKDSSIIFVIGMPRSGTTLMDRILSNHSLVKSVGEINFFEKGLFSIDKGFKVQENGALNFKPLQADDFRRIGERFLKMVVESSDKNRYYIDKSPVNFLYLGYILKALPNSKVICMKRNGADTCFSNYRQLFSQNAKKYNYSYDLNETAKYYSEFESIMAYWHECYPEKILNVQYEDLVNDFDNQLQRVFKYCNLELEPSCSKFYTSKQSVSTASFSQVREPLTDRFVERWKHYRPYIKEYQHFNHLIEVN